MSNRTALYGQIFKVEDEDDGTIKVYGVASTGDRDSVGEIVTPDAMRAALPSYLAFPAIREMHQSNVAAGSAVEISVDDDTGATNIVAHVVDPLAIAKVKSQTYRGFSIGGKVLKRDPTDRSIITALDLIEVSLVDRPANPQCTLDMWKSDFSQPKESPMPTAEEIKKRAQEMADAAGKPNRRADYVVKARAELIAKAEGHADAGEPIVKRDYSDDERQQMAKDGQAMPDGSFPIKDKSDLENAIQAYGRASNKMQAKSHIEARAHALGADDMLPADWHGDDASKKAAEADPVSALQMALDAAKAEASPVAPAALDLSSPRLIKAAWARHCLQPSLADADEARAQIAKAWTDQIDLDGPPSMALVKSLTDAKLPDAVQAILKSADALEKGLPTVARFAYLIDELTWLQDTVTYEAEREGDNSPVPAQLAQNIAALCATLTAMLAEEVAEILAAYQASDMDIDFDPSDDDDADVIAYAATIADIVKADTVRMTKAAARLPGPPVEDAEKAAIAGERDRLAKALSDAIPAVEDLRKALASQRETHEAETTELKKRLETIETLALPPKTAANAHAVSKGADRSGVPETQASTDGPGDEDVQTWLASLSPEQRAFELMKAAHAHPFRA